LFTITKKGILYIQHQKKDLKIKIYKVRKRVYDINEVENPMRKLIIIISGEFQMKTFNKTVLAATIAMLVSPVVFAGNLPEGLTGYATQLVNGKEVIVGKTYKVGETAKVTKVSSVTVLPTVDMPVEYQTLNQDSIGMVKFDTKVLKSLKKGEVAKLDFLGIPKDANVLNQLSHENGDNTLVASTGSGDRTIITFGSDGSVVGSATVDGHYYSVSTDNNGNTWMVDNTTSGATHAGFDHDTVAPHISLGAALTTTPVVAPTVVTPTVSNPNVQLLVYVANSIPNSATVVNNLVAVANQAYVDSNVKMTLKAAKIVVVTDPQPGNEYNALSMLANAQGVFNTLAADKAVSNADLVTFIHPLKVAQGMCGLGYLNGGNGTAYSKKNTFNVVSYGTDGSYYCNYYTLAHELGHNMGMVHDTAHSIGVAGHFTDSYGYGLAGAYGDLMSYFPQNGVFSSPDKYWKNCSRFPYGVINKADVSRGLNAVATEISNFHLLTK
jgi:hypothetical protein